MKLRNAIILILVSVLLLGASTQTSHHSLSGLYRDDHPQYVRKDGTRPLQDDWDAGQYTITALGIDVTDITFSGQMTSTVATGTAPFVIASTTVNTNLNADLWDGYQFADYLDQAVRTTDHPTFNGIQFGLTPGLSPAEGLMYWNADDGTVNLGMPGGNVNLQVGEEMLIRARNNSGVTIPNGAPVYISGSTGIRPEISLASSTNHLVANATIAVATEEILDTSFGYVNTFGLVRDIDTSMVSADGKPVFLSTVAGELSATLPTQPDSQVFIGVVIKKHVTEGILLVKIIPQPNLDELSDIFIDSVSDTEIIAWDNSDSRWENKTATVDIPINISMFDAVPSRGKVSNWNGGLDSLITGQVLGPATPANDISVSKGIGKIVIVVNAGTDLAGDITITGTSVDRNTGVTTGADTDTITVDALTTDNTTTDSNGNDCHVFVGAYISSKWFTGTVVLSTSTLNLSDVDVYHCSFEQINDQPNLVLNTFDVNLYTTNVNAEFDAYLQTLHVIGDKCNVDCEAGLHLGADGETALVDKYWRLRRGNINEAVNGSTDGLWVNVFYSNSPVYIEDVTIKVWLTKSQTLTLN